MALSPQPGPGEDIEEPPALRRLRWLVTTLMVVLIFGMLAIVAVFVIRLGGIGQNLADSGLAAPISAEAFALPAGEEVTALGRAGNQVLMLTRDAAGEERLRSFDAATGAAISESSIARR